VRRFKKIKNDFIYHFIRGIIAFFNFIPRTGAIFIGAMLGFWGYLIFRKDRYKANRHLIAAYGDALSQTERDRIICQMFINFGKNAADVIRFRKYYRSEIMPLVAVEGLEHFDVVYNRGKGMIAVTGHIGNFELIAAHMAALGYKVAVIGREVYDKRLNYLLVKNREAMGAVNIDTKESVKKLVRLLKEGYALGALIDTDSIRVRTMFVPFLGRLSNTPVGQSILGLRTGAGFVPLACVRDGKRYRIIIKPEITIERTDNFEKDVYNITRLCSEALETIINEYREQWIWLHNRWQTRPAEPIIE
jgi:KDO2-lipid IV(A) lauroyltransferase